jgi:hypothetical protein
MATEKPAQISFAAMAPQPDAAHLNAMLASVLRAQAKMFDPILRQNIELLDFLCGRFKQDRALLADVARASDSHAAVACCADFVARARTDYTEAAGRLGALAAASTEQLIEAATDEATALAGGNAKAA